MGCKFWSGRRAQVVQVQSGGHQPNERDSPSPARGAASLTWWDGSRPSLEGRQPGQRESGPTHSVANLINRQYKSSLNAHSLAREMGALPSQRIIVIDLARGVDTLEFRPSSRSHRWAPTNLRSCILTQLKETNFNITQENKLQPSSKRRSPT